MLKLILFYLVKIGLFIFFIMNSGFADNTTSTISSSNPPAGLHHQFSVPVSRLSYYQLSKQDTLELNNGRPYPGNTEKYLFKKTFSSDDTAFFVIDPWNDSPSNFMNQYNGKIVTNYIVPLITEASKNNFHVYIFTNDCNYKPKPWGCAISNSLYSLAQQNKKVQLVYWQYINTNDFVKLLKSQGISKLIYLGFSSNICIIERPTGMVSMINQNFSLYFIPEASAAVETRSTWKTQEIHKAMTTVISQFLAEIIQYRDIYAAMKGSKSNK